MNSKRLLLAVLISAPFALTVTGCSSSSDAGSHTIRVLNLEDYIYIDEEDETNNLTHQFERWANKEFGFDDVKVVYDTSDTNESEYNDLLTGRINYDLVCTSDYMLQKFVREDLVVPLDKDALENYNTYASSTIKQRLDEIEVTKGNETVYLEDYAVGYMWGTLGLLVNPEFSLMEDNGLDFDTVISDAQSWDILWNENYKNTASIKNSMRDTYAVALMHGYDDVLEALKIAHNREIDPISDEEYNAELSYIFNLTDSDNTLPMVRKELDNLKQNIFGMEVDSGKQDIVTGKIGLNLAWSGDAVYSMDQAENEELVSDPFELYYAIPENGSNIWFDGWAVPKNDKRSDITFDLAMAFLDFISDPEIAALNMDYSGYTSFIGGDSILDLVRDWYDVRTEEVYQTVYYCGNEDCEWSSIVYPDGDKCPDCKEELNIVEESYQIYASYDEKYFPVTYLDLVSESHDEECDDYLLSYFVPFIEVNEDEEVEIIEEPRDIDELFENGDYVFIYDEDEEEYTDDIKTYGDLWIVDEDEEIQAVDLTYFFDGTLEDYTEADMIFYSDCYLPFSSDEEGEENNISVGRQFFCQYPSEETINRCAIMVDYGEDNIKIVKLWEDFKSNPLPVWGIILIIAEVTLAGLVITYFATSKYIKKKLRVARKGTPNNEKK